ncbi:hypothetical protein AB1Y20_001671 [Prymnesium parvum]|uniref:GHMP kinase N-terminal domain-containing protein n=1 Tax=Prymnesium parvum TaxID=97485 RepID=A0AB34KCB5_PRYPA
MVGVIFVAGHNDRLEREIAADLSGEHEVLKGVPKALLPAARGDNTTILGRWWEELNKRQQFSEVYLVTNANKYKYYERWATANDFPVENIVNDGTTTKGSRIGSVADLDLVLRTKGIDDCDIMVVAGDMLFSRGFDISGVQRFFQEKKGDVAVYYELSPSEQQSSRGIIEIDPRSSRIERFYEKPAEGVTSSRLASVVFYIFSCETLRHVPAFLETHTQADDRVFGRLLQSLVQEGHRPLYGMKLATAFQLIGATGLQEYLDCAAAFARRGTISHQGVITRRVHARVGLMGNPSDGFFGKTIAVSVSNFWAEVSIHESATLRLVPNALSDPNDFGSLADLHGISRKEGYQGGLILLQATCKKFYEYCTKQGISLAKRNFTLRYNTNIPRQVGLAGSSAIVTAAFQCLMGFFGLTARDIPKELQPNFVLSVEMEELFIQAGLQDRVIQTYEGCMFMDFSKELLESQGHGNYVRLPVENLPFLWLAYLSDPSNSGKIHSDVKARWSSGEKCVVDAMRTFGAYTDEGRKALLARDWETFGKLMDANFALRREIYGDACLGESNLAMIEIAQRMGMPVKFPGSGGAVVGMSHTEAERERIKAMYENAGYVFTKLVPHEPTQLE